MFLSLYNNVFVKAGDTPLHLATSCYLTQPEYVEVVRELLENGADVNGKNVV